MRLLAVHTSSPYWDQAVCFAQQAIGKTGGSLTSLHVVAGSDALGTDGLPPEVKVRRGDFYQQVLAEIQDGSYDLVVVGSDPPTIAIPQVETGEYLARLCSVPVAIVRNCPAGWHKALVCTRTPHSESHIVRTGRELAAQLGIEPTILHIAPPQKADVEPAGEVKVRSGSLEQEIQAEIGLGEHTIAIIGAHGGSLATPAPASSPTLADPDATHQILRFALPVVIVIGQPASLAPASGPSTLLSRPNELRKVVRAVAIELVLYGALVVGYAAIAFHLLSNPLKQLFQDNLGLYAIIALLLIVGQGVMLEEVTSFLLNRLRLERFD